MSSQKRLRHQLSIAIMVSLLAITVDLSANPAPVNSPSARSVFSANPIYSPGIKPSMIIDAFGVIDATLTQQKRDKYKNRIAEWAAAGISYGAYYNLSNIESDIRYTLSNGGQINPDGTAITGDNAGQVFYPMSPTRQAFKDYLIDSAKLAIDLGVTHIFLDNASVNFSTLSFDDEVVSAFANYINEPGYDIRTLVVSASYNKSSLINVNDAALTGDPYWQKWLNYDSVIEQDFFSVWSTTLKDYAASKSQTINLSANRYIDGTQTNDGWMTEKHLDYTLAETFLDTLGYPDKDINFAYKTSLALGKRFWSWSFPNNTDSLDDVGGVNDSSNQASNNADRLFVAQTFANGGLSQVGGASWVNFIANDIKPIVTVPDYKLVQSYPALFNLAEASEIAILYGEYAMKNDPAGLGASFKGASYLLSDAHWLWDVVFAADENRAGFTSDPLTLAKLSEYQTILIPNVMQLSNTQIAVIESFLNASPSNTVIGFGTVATNSETNTDETANRTFDDLFGIDAVNTAAYSGTVIAFAADLGKSTADNATDASIRISNVSSFNAVVNPVISPMLSTTLPPTIQITRFIDETDGSHIYHLVNTDINLSTDVITSVTAGETLTVPSPASFTNVSIISPEILTPAVSSNLTITLPALNSWTIIKVGSNMPVAIAVDNYPWSQMQFRNSITTTIDDAFDMNGNRPDTLNASGKFEYDYWYWKNATTTEDPNVTGFNFDIAFLATDDIGISQVQLFYRYSADYNVWSSWFSGQVITTGINGVDLFKITGAPFGDGHYQFYSRATDTAGQLEYIIKGAETGYGIDTVGPDTPATFTETNGVSHGVWQTSVTTPTFSWATPVDRISGAKEAWINIDDIENGATIASCNNINLLATSAVNPASCITPLSALNNGRYRVRFQSKDAAANSSNDEAVFELRVGTKTVQDPQNPIAIAQEGSVIINWNAPADTTNFDEVSVFVTRVSEPQNLWGQATTLSIASPLTDNSITVNGLTNGITYRVAIEAFNRTENLPGDLILISNAALPRVFNYGITVQESEGSTTVTEGGISDTYNIALNEQPSANVIIDLTTDLQLTINPAAIIFTPATWNTPQTVYVSATNDTIVESALSSSIMHTLNSTDSNYTGLSIPTINVSVLDNDVKIKRKKRNFFGCTLRNKNTPIDPTFPVLIIGSLLYFAKKSKLASPRQTKQCPK